MKILTLAFLPLLASCVHSYYSYDPKDKENPVKEKTAARQTPSKDEPAPKDVAVPQGRVGSVFPYVVSRGTFDNGMKAIVIPMPSEGLVSYWTLVRTGSRDEVEQGVTGFAHFFEHMMFRGSEKYPGKEYDRIVSQMGASANAYTTDDYTAYHLSFGKEDLATVAEIESDRFQNLRYDETQFKTESGAVYGEYRKGRTNPYEVLYESLQDRAFDRHTYKHTTIGFEADIQRMPQQFEYSKGFFQRFYRPENVVVVVAGDVDPQKTMALLYEKYRGWGKGYQAPSVAEEPEQTAQRRVDVPFDGQTLPILAIGFKGERFIPNNRLVMAGLLVGDLCFGETSPLYRKLVLDEQRVEQIPLDVAPKRDPGLWTVMALVKDPSDVGAVEREVWKALDAMRLRGVSRERLEEVRSRWKYAFLGSLSTPDQVAQTLAPLVAITGDIDCVFQMFSALDQVTPEDVRDAIQAYYVPERSTVAVVHAKDEAVPLAKADTSGMVLMPVPQDPNVAIKLWFKAGSQDDPAGKEGLAALTAAMLAEGGTKKRPYEEILARLYPLAASYGGEADKEMTVFSGVAHRDNARAFAEILAEAVTEPGFRAEDFERLRTRAVNEIEKSLRYSSDEELGKATLVETVFAGTPYAHLVLGSVASLRAITLEDVKAFHANYFTKDNVVIGLGGAFDDRFAGDLRASLAALPPGTPPRAPRSIAKPVEGRHATIVQKPGPSTAISFGYPIDVPRGSKEYYALSVARSWLGEHRSSFSHLYQVIREERGLNYGDYAYIEAFPGGGRRFMPPTGVGRRSQLFEVWIRPVQEKNAVFALRAALREVESLSKNGLTKEQFEAARGFLRKYCLHYAETTADRLGYALEDRFYGIEPHLAAFRKAMDEVTVDEVNAAIRRHLRAENLTIALVTEHAEALRDAILSDAPSPIAYDAAKPKEITDEDAVIARYALRIKPENVRVVPVDEMFAR